MRFFKFRYSLRTFFVVIAIIACWLGYHLRIKSQRQEMLAWIVQQGGEYQTYEVFEKYKDAIGYPALGTIDSPVWYAEKRPQVSVLRAWLGDPPICYIKFGNLEHINQVDEGQITDLFPEAQVIIGLGKACEQMRFQKLSELQKTTIEMP